MNRAARRERKLLLKQQEEIERIQHTTLKLREKLRNAGDTNQVSLHTLLHITHFITQHTHTRTRIAVLFLRVKSVS